MAGNGVDPYEILVTSPTSMIQRVADAVAQAQLALDKGALERQGALQTDHPELAAVGYQVSWYHMPEVSLELKMTVHYEAKGQGGPGRILVSPFNAKYKSAFSYEADGASTLSLRIVPLPPPTVAAPPT